MKKNNSIKHRFSAAETKNKIKKLNHRIKSLEKCIIVINEFSDLLDYLNFKDRDIFQSMFLGFTAESIGADRVLLYFYEKEEDLLYPGLIMVYKNNKLLPYDYYSELKNVIIKNGEDVCGHALRKKAPIHLKKIDKKIYKGIIDNKIGMEINSIISIPIIIHDYVYGIIEVANTKNKKPLNNFDHYVVSIISKLANSRMERSQLLSWANTDNLTQLYNFHYYQLFFEENLFKTGKSPRYLSIVIIDIDDFKKINDTYGHPAGNTVLKMLSKIIKNSIDENKHIPIRYGGDEFLLLLIETELDQAKKISEKILHTVRDYNFKLGPDNVKITLSIGINYQKLDADINRDNFLKQADSALYQSKNTGKNRISIG